MKSINIHCPCGASIQLEDDAESYINEDQSPDDQGRLFLIEVRSDEWQERHQPCIDAKVKLLTQKKSKKIEAEDWQSWSEQ